MDTRMLELLVCPICKGPLEHWRESHELACRADRLAFPIRDGMPVMLEAQARSFDPDAPHGPVPPIFPPSAPTPAASPESL
jgi:uncharacterized protein